MHIHSTFRRRLLGSSALVAGAFFMATSGAQAVPSGSCVGGPVANNVTIICSGYSSSDVTGNGDDVTLTLNPAASINISGTTNSNYAETYAVKIGGNSNNVTLNGGSDVSLYVTTSNKDTYSTALFLSGSDNAVTLNNSSVTAHAFNELKYAGTTIGTRIYGSGSSLTLNGTSLVDVRADNDGKYSNDRGHTFGVQINGDGTTLALNGSSQVNVYANNRNRYSETYGVRMYGEGATVTLNGSSKVAVDVRNYGNYGTAKGVELQGDNAKLTLNGTSSIDVTAAAHASGNHFYGAAVAGLTPIVTLNDASSINLTGTGSNSSYYTGLAVGERAIIDYSSDQTIADVNVGRVTLNGSSSVNVKLNGSSSVTATGVDLGGDRRPVRSMNAPVSASLTLNGSSSINVTGSGNSSTYIGVNARNKYANITLNDQSSVNVSSDGDNRASTGIQADANNATITLNGHASINVGNAKYVTGIALSGAESQVTLNGDASIHVAAGLSESNGVVLDGQRDTLTFNDNSSLVVDGAGNAILISNSSNNSIELNGTSSVTATNGVGVYVNGGYNNSLTLNGNATLTSYHEGVKLNAAESTSITLNGRSQIASSQGAGIRVTGSQYYNSYYEETYNYPSRDTRITLGQGTTVSGTTGILVDENAENTFVHVSGTVIGTDGTAIDFTQANNSTLELGTGANIVGSIAGSGGDSLILTGVGRFSNVITGFNYLSVQADKGGIWNLTSSLDLDGGNVDIQSGQLSVNGTLDAGTVNVEQGGTLGGSGTINGNVIVAGLLSPGNSPGTLTVVGNVNFTPGSGFKVQVEGNKADLLNVIGGGVVTIDPGTSITMEFLGGVDGFVGDVISSGNPVVGTFTTFNGGVFNYSTPGFVSLTSASPSAPNAGMTGGTVVGFTFLDAVIGNAENGIGRSSGLWGTGLYNQTNRSSMGTSKGVDVQGSGLAMGGDVFRTENFGLGLAGGYIDSTATTQGGGSDTDIKGYNVAAYSTYSMGNTFLTAAATAAYQNQDVTRRVLSMGTVTAANSSPDAWTAGAGASLGHTIPLQGTWTITPRASVGWQHFARDGYSEAGGGLGAMSLDSVQSDTMRGQVGAELAFTIKDPNAIWSVRPSVRAALAKELRSGDSTVNGRFLASGAAFSGKVDDRDQTYTAIGAGVDVVVGAGLTAFVQYDGSVGGEIEKSGGVRVGARFEW